MSTLLDIPWVPVAGVVFGVAVIRSLWKKSRHEPTEKSTVLITGCDSGLGFSLALHSYKLGLTVIASCLNSEGAGATKLIEECPGKRMHVIEMDVTNEDSVKRSVSQVQAILQANPTLEFKCLVNNAAVMVFGEFEWQTERLIRQQVEVNILGTLRVTKSFCSMLRHYQGRIITVSSHCALESLPGLATYGATKGAIRAWSDSLRVEEAKYGVAVITIVPGSFVGNSSIMSRHPENAKEMEANMSVEDKNFYGDYFHVYHSYLMAVSDPNRPPTAIQDPALHEMFADALLSCNPRSNYTHGPLRYTIYYFLFKISPVWLRDWLVVRFVQMPAWVKK